MAWRYEDVTPTLIENTTMQKGINDDGIHKTYRIIANEGYLLHDKRVDVEEIDPETLEPTGVVTPWFKGGATTVPASYDFNSVVNGTYTYADENGNENTINVNKIGVYEFYTVPESIVPTNQTCGNTDPETETA